MSAVASPSARLPGELATGGAAPPGKGDGRMRSRIVVVVVLVALTALVATWSLAAGPKQYQWTG